MLKTVLSLVLLAGLALVAYVRFSPMGAEWHADPTRGDRTGKPNDYLIGPGGERDPLILSDAPAEVAMRIDAAAMAEAGVTRLAGMPEDGHVTYVQRSNLMGYPDAISVKADPRDGGTALTIWSRSRYGHSDLGVNEARVRRWLAAAGISP